MAQGIRSQDYLTAFFLAHLTQGKMHSNFHSQAQMLSQCSSSLGGASGEALNMTSVEAIEHATLNVGMRQSLVGEGGNLQPYFSEFTDFIHHCRPHSFRLQRCPKVCVYTEKEPFWGASDNKVTD